MPFEKMRIPGAWVFSPIRHSDDRGFFEEKFKLSQIESELGRSFQVVQVNQSVSRIGVIRGIHFTTGTAGQAKYVACSRGRVWDVVVDVRPHSETYGQWDAVELSNDNGKSVLISEGLGHAFLALEDHSAVNYLCNSEFDRINDSVVNPFSKSLSIDFQLVGESNGINSFTLSDRDANAPEF
jgi:dTDP-4-dehydrorhamnose 3,5-epimerase